MPIVVAILLIVIGLPMGIALIAILTEHQRKMAEIMHRSSANKEAMELLSGEVANLRAQLAETRDLVNQQVLAQDNAPVIPADSEIYSRQGGR